jgi:hypothetical protein
MKDIFNALAFILIIVAFIPYAKAVWRDRNIPSGTPGKTEPSKASWIIWVALDIITAIGMYMKGSLNGQITAAVIGGSMVAVLAMKFGTSDWTRLDKGCLAGAFLGIILWKVFGDAVAGIITCQVVMFIGSLPTFSSAWKDPGRENKTAWTLFWLSCVSALIAIPGLTLEILFKEPVKFFLDHLSDTAQPVTFFIIETIVVGILLVRPWFIARGKIISSDPMPHE